MARVILPGQFARTRGGAWPAESLTFDAVIAVLGAWFVAGAFLDGWAHQHVPSLETFFTPWHAVLYSGFFAVAAVILIRAAQNWMRGYAPEHVLPASYTLSLLGVLLFMIGAVSDLTWHTLFGIEADVEALLSPTHLLLAAGGALTITGPLRSAWRGRLSPSRPREYLPMLLSTLYVIALLMFFTQYIHPFGETFAAKPIAQSGTSFTNQALGVSSILLQTAILMGLILLLVRRFQLPFGSLTLLVGVSTLLVVLMRNNSSFGQTLSTGPLPLIAVGVLGGLVGDTLLIWARPSSERPAAFRIFAFALPFALYALYFSAIALFGGGIGWKIHLWAGAIAQAGIVGWLLSYAFLPPAVQD